MRTTLLLIFSLVSTISLTAQSVTPTVIASGGGSGQVGDVTVMWTVGEVAVTTLRASDLYVTQGFHQPPLGTTDAPVESQSILTLATHPNPVSDVLSVVLPSGTAAGSFTLVDLLGRTVLSRPTSAGAGGLTLEIGQLPAGTYVARYVVGESVYGTTVTVQR